MKKQKINLPNSTHLHVVQMNRWIKPKKPAMQPLDYWIYFFMKANGWKHLPKDAIIPEISEAMTVLEEFSNDPEKLEYYRSRHNIQLAEQSVETENRQIREDYDNAIKQRDNAVKQKNNAIAKLDHSNAEIDQLKLSKLKLAKALLGTNTMSIEQIAATADISVEEVANLNR